MKTKRKLRKEAVAASLLKRRARMSVINPRAAKVRVDRLECQRIRKLTRQITGQDS